MSRFLDKRIINAGLVEHVEAFAETEFHPRPIKSYAADIRVGDTGSISIKWDGSWYSFRDDCGGSDLIGLIIWNRQCGFPDALEIGAAFLDDRETTCKPATAARSTRRTASEQSEQSAIENAKHHWRRGDDIEGTLAERYLLRTRGIRFIPNCARYKLRFVKKLWHKRSEAYYPALIAKVQQPNGAFGGIFRIYLDPETADKIKDSPKMRLGSVPGAAIRFARTAEEVVICEGVEDALTILSACPAKTVWCGMGGNTKSVIFPAEVRRIVIAADNDPAGESIAQDLAHRLVAEERTVSICKPAYGKDFNQLMKGE